MAATTSRRSNNSNSSSSSSSSRFHLWHRHRFSSSNTYHLPTYLPSYLPTYQAPLAPIPLDYVVAASGGLVSADSANRLYV